MQNFVGPFMTFLLRPEENRGVADSVTIFWYFSQSYNRRYTKTEVSLLCDDMKSYRASTFSSDFGVETANPTLASFSTKVEL